MVQNSEMLFACRAISASLVFYFETRNDSYLHPRTGSSPDVKEFENMDFSTRAFQNAFEHEKV